MSVDVGQNSGTAVSTQLVQLLTALGFVPRSSVDPSFIFLPSKETLQIIGLDLLALYFTIAGSPLVKSPCEAMLCRPKLVTSRT